MATKTRTGSRASRTRATNPARPPASAPSADRYYAGKVTVARSRVDVPMLVLRGEWLKAIGFPIGAKAFLSTEAGRHPAHAQRPQAATELRVLKAKSLDATSRWAEAHLWLGTDKAFGRNA